MFVAVPSRVVGMCGKRGERGGVAWLRRMVGRVRGATGGSLGVGEQPVVTGSSVEGSPMGNDKEQFFGGISRWFRPLSDTHS
eukprot:6779649-Pyramimonas_sp.AAC.1